MFECFITYKRLHIIEVFTMVCIDSTLINFLDKDLFLSIFEGYNNDFEYTADGVFRRATQP